MEESKIPEDALSMKEREKLDLEIESLRKGNKKLDLEVKHLRKQGKWVLFRNIAAIVAILTLIFAVYKFYVEQNKERVTRDVEQKLKFQNQIRADVDQILNFPRDPGEAPSKISFLLQDMNIIMGSQINEKQKVMDVFPSNYQRTISESLANLIVDDTNFIKSPRDVRFATTVLAGWPDYESYLRKKPKMLGFILYKYVRALRYLRDRNPGYFERMDYVKSSDEYIIPPEYEKREDSERLYETFLDIRDGFKAHIRLLSDERVSDERADERGLELGKLREQRLREFQAALCNPKISKSILPVYFPDEGCEE